MSNKNQFSSTLPERAVNGSKEKATLSRRRHQDGNLIELQHGWAVRYYTDYVDDNGVRCRSRVQKLLGDFKKLPTKRAAQNAMQVQLALVNNATAPLQSSTVNFRQQSAIWMQECRNRKWRPIKQSVLVNWQGALDNHILKVLGDVPLSDVRNRSMHTLVERLSAKGTLGPSSIRNITRVAKMVVQSAVDDEGDPLFPVKWKARLINAPTVDPKKQNRPTFTVQELDRLVQASGGRPRMIIVLLAATGMRVGELLGLEVRHFDGQSLQVEQAVWRGRVQAPKTSNAYRTVELSADVALLLTQFIGSRKVGYIFQSCNGKPLNTRNCLRLLYSTLKSLGISKRGFHALRRFRIAHLRNSQCPPGVVRYWVGHAAGNITETYDQSCTDAQFRRDVAKAMGTGFAVPKTVFKQKPQTQNRALLGVAAEAVAL